VRSEYLLMIRFHDGEDTFISLGLECKTDDGRRATRNCAPRSILIRVPQGAPGRPLIKVNVLSTLAVFSWKYRHGFHL
jgi:hypothetical protein